MVYNNSIARFSVGLFVFIFMENSFCTDYNWSANLRYRLKTDTSNDVEENSVSSFSEMRSRIGLDVLGDNATAHFILQDSRIIGAPDNSAGVTGNTIGSTLHQVYFTYEGYKRTFQVGRFELALGNQRIIAKNNWNNTGRSFEGILVKRKTQIGERLLFTLPVVETYDTEHDDSKDHVLSGMYWDINLPGIGEGSKVEPYIMNYQQVQDNGSYNMFGCRADLKRNSILFEGEFAMQSSRRIKANILSLNLGYKIDQFNWLKSLTAGLDIVSGDDPETGDLEGFSKYFGARHKHHGYYDYGLHKKYFGHTHEGLQELNLKGRFNFIADFNLLVAMHNFSSHDGKTAYGNELDLIIKRKVSDDLSSEFGLVFYDPDEGDDLLTFMYVMFTANL